ncbi:17-beta-hydroxysteroid dehydrogenase 13 isoform X2 [Frieseomelitta varia]|nr:17-beta-hydroxysteroid dehydrogenase 13 isoform X2 [Frieseomelitta varia]XP_043513969.1 17-beta-hydroxysteroid dehydrogenase 13 isoform X2 [Frieseomelitta varia]XP_043513970.1 17-beta-hydroxysteroid dehydrogenase 13 isoform X2 [Frieseomelitta varia]
MIKRYAVILIDVLLLFSSIIYNIIKGIYKLCIPDAEKSVLGEVVLITGTGHGIGRELALKYASLGATVVCWDINEQGNNETVEEIKQNGVSRAYGYKCDVSNREEVIETAEKVKKEVGDVTILINNAGIMPSYHFVDHTPELIKRVFDINVLSHHWILQAFLPNMIQNDYGHIVSISSMAGLFGLPNIVPYCSSKFAVRGLMEALCEELRVQNGGKPSNIKFTTIYPYMVNTGLCKKPLYRFQSMQLISIKEAVDAIIKAQRRNIREVSIPSYWFYINSFMRCMPHSCREHTSNFLKIGVDVED